MIIFLVFLSILLFSYVISSISLENFVKRLNFSFFNPLLTLNILNFIKGCIVLISARLSFYSVNTGDITTACLLVLILVISVYAHLFPFFSKTKANRKALYLSLGLQFSLIPVEFVLSILIFWSIYLILKNIRISLVLSNMTLPILVYINLLSRSSEIMWIYFSFFILNNIMVLMMHKKYYYEWLKKEKQQLL